MSMNIIGICVMKRGARECISRFRHTRTRGDRTDTKKPAPQVGAGCILRGTDGGYLVSDNFIVLEKVKPDSRPVMLMVAM